MAQTKIIYGMHAVLAALEHHPENILTLFCQEKEESIRLKELLVKAKANALDIQTVSRVKLDKLTAASHHQGIAAKMRVKVALGEKDLIAWLDEPSKKPLLLILDGVQDPHNLGACLRSAEALGVDWVVVPKANSAPLNATVSKVACGADQILPVVEVANVVRFIKQIQDKGVWVVGTAAEAEIPLSRIDLKRQTAIVMGAEGKGIKRLILESCDEIAKIPLQGTVSSLNVSVATGICLYECVRQRQ